MSNNLKTILLGLAFFLLCSVAVYFYGNHKGYVRGRDKGYAVGYENGYAAGYDAPHPADTTIVIDTTHHDKPEPSEVRPADGRREKLLLGTIAQLRARLDSLSAAKPDTAFVEVPVPIEEKIYEDSTYRAQISGYRPQLDWIDVFQRTQTITNYIVQPAPRFSFGVSAGPGVVYNPLNGSLHGGVAVLVGAQFRF